MNDPYIYIRKHALPQLLCEEIITFFENNKQLHNDGSTIGGVHKNVKDTTDIYIDMHDIKQYPDEIMKLIKDDKNLNKYLVDKEIKKKIYIKNKLINIII